MFFFEIFKLNFHKLFFSLLKKTVRKKKKIFLQRLLWLRPELINTQLTGSLNYTIKLFFLLTLYRGLSLLMLMWLLRYISEYFLIWFQIEHFNSQLMYKFYMISCWNAFYRRIAFSYNYMFKLIIYNVSLFNKIFRLIHHS